GTMEHALVEVRGLPPGRPWLGTRSDCRGQVFGAEDESGFDGRDSSRAFAGYGSDGRGYSVWVERVPGRRHFQDLATGLERQPAIGANVDDLPQHAPGSEHRCRLGHDLEAHGQRHYLKAVFVRREGRKVAATAVFAEVNVVVTVEEAARHKGF